MTFEELKQKQSAMWGSAPFENIADELLGDIHDHLVSRGVGDMFQMLGEFQPPPPEGAGSPLAWGTREYQQQLLGDAFELEFEDGNSPDEQESAKEMWELMSTSFGPLKTLYASLEGDRPAQLRARMLEFMESYRDGDLIRQPREYLLTIGTRR